MFEQNLAGVVIDERFEILSPAGEGGMGSIYKARMVEQNKLVAIKLLHSTLLNSSVSRARFDREGKILSSLAHPHITTFHHFGVWNNRYPYIVMEYLEGLTLRDIINKDRLSLERTLKVTVQICDAMAFAHAQGIVHRDLKPNNVMLLDTPNAPEFVKMLDFGLARLQPQPGDAKAKLTRTGTLIGSMYYMSPEQCQGEHADTRSDIYALGCMFYETMSGEPPVVADNPIALMTKHIYETPVPLSEKLRQKKLPRELDDILSKAMAKDPAARYQSMDEFKHDLQMLQWGKTRDIKASKGRRSKISFFGLRIR